MKIAISAFTLLLLTPSVHAQAPTRQPWEWTDAERIAERTNPDRIRERVAEAEANILATQGAKPGTYILGDSITGKRHPELFLPIELFQSLLDRTVAQSRNDIKTGFRVGIEQRTRQRLPEKFWERLTSISSKYADVAMRTHALIESSPSPNAEAHQRLQQKVAELSAGQCRELYEGLQRARAEFGAAFFDRFLYETVAPGSGVTFAHAPSVAQLTSMVEGCK